MASTVASKLVLEAWQPWKGEMRIHRGGTFDPSMEWTNDDGDAIDWTGYTGRAVITLNVGADGSEVDPPTVHTLTTENGGMTMNADGTITLYMSDTVTENIVECGGTFKFYITEPDSDVRLFGRGTVKVE